jgi:Gly-Xaa carboxypeptidase
MPSSLFSLGARKNPLEDKSYSKKAMDRLSRSVQIATVSFDDMGEVGKDPRFEGVANFNNFLDDEFPTMSVLPQIPLRRSHFPLFTLLPTLGRASLRESSLPLKFLAQP